MLSEAALLHESGDQFAIEQIEIGPLGRHEVLVELAACGVCHTDLHMASNRQLAPPVILGHEGAGVVAGIGSSVSRWAPGDRVLTSLYACGVCSSCTAGRMHLCRNARSNASGDRATFHTKDGQPVTRYAAGAFSRHAVVDERALIGLDADIPLDVACLLACGVSTGWGAAVNRARVAPGESVVVWGCGGVGLAAVAGAAHAGAGAIVAVDTLAAKTAAAVHHGATHQVAGGALSAGEAGEAARQALGGTGADVVIIAAGSLDQDLFAAAYRTVGVGGRLVTVSAGATALQIPDGDLNIAEKTIMGSLMGSASPAHTIGQLTRLYQAGRLDLEAFVSRRYPLPDINEAVADLVAGKNVRGVLTLR